MKPIYLIFSLLIFICASCTSKSNKDVSEGILTFAIDYPDSKENFFLYHVLPKELKTSFKNNQMELKIKKANMENTLIINSDKKNITAYFNYGDIFTSFLTPSDINKTINKHPSYSIEITKEKDTLIGFDIRKAIAINPAFPDQKMEIWFTEDIKFKNPNWFNGFEKIPGVLLKYSIIQYGIKMEFKATKFENVSISDSVVNQKRPGNIIPHGEYDKRINELFESFK